MAGFDKIEQILNIKVTGGSEIAQLNRRIEELSAKQKVLRKNGKAGTAEFAQQKTQLKGLRSEYNKAAKEVNRLAMGQKKAGSFTGKLTKSFAGMALKVAGVVSIFTTMNRVLSDAFKTMRDFEFGMAKVKAISGATAEEFEKLKNSAQILGRTTFFTASQVAELQLNLSKLGFSTQEILNSQEAILQLSTAMGDDLGRTATVVASSLRGFGESTIETQRFVDVMAKAFSSSALDLEKFQTSMSKVSAIASMAGFSFEETTAMLGLLTDRGIEASIAGTSLRNILLHLQDPSSDLSKNLGRTVHSGEDLIKALKELKDSGVDVAGVMEIVDRRQVQAMNSFIDSSDSLDTFITKLNESEGAGADMADVMENTVTGALNKVKSAWEGFVLAITDEESGIGATIKKILEDNAWLLNYYAERWGSASMNASNIVAQEVRNAKAIYKDQNEFLKTMSEADQEIYKRKYADILSDVLSEMQDKIPFLEKEVQRVVDDNKVMLAIGDSVAEEKVEQAKKALKAQQIAVNEMKSTIQQELQNEIDAEAERKELAEEQEKQAEFALKRKEKREKREAEIAKKKKEREREEAKRAAEKALRELEQGIVSDAEAGAAEARQGYLQAYLDGAITKEQLDARLHQLELDRLREIQQEREKAGLSVVEITEKILQMKQKEKTANEEAATAAQKKADDEAKADTEKTQKMMQNAIMNSENANEAFQKIITAKVNEILLDAMSSMWADKTIPFVAKLGLALGMKSIVLPLISKMLGGGEKYANGGLTEGGMFQGASHANGGVKFAVGGRIHEAEGGEAIINKRSTAQFKPILSAINSYNGYGKKFAMGGITDGVHSKYALGGMTASSIGDIVSGGAGAQTVMVVESDITRTQGRVSAIEAQASF